MNHTPGEWTYEVENEQHPFGVVRFFGMGGKIPLGYWNKQPGQMERILADANLIVAAPDLLAACKQNVTALESLARTLADNGIILPMGTLIHLEDALKVNRRIIAEVEGNTEGE